MSRKYIGDFKGVPFYVDPNCPPGKIYFMNDSLHKLMLAHAGSGLKIVYRYLYCIFCGLQDVISHGFLDFIVGTQNGIERYEL